MVFSKSYLIPWIAGTALQANSPKCHHPPYKTWAKVVGIQNTPTIIPDTARLTV